MIFILLWSVSITQKSHTKAVICSWCQAMRIMFMLNTQFHDLLNMLKAFEYGKLLCMCMYHIVFRVLYCNQFGKRINTYINSSLIFFHVKIISLYIWMSWCIHLNKMYLSPKAFVMWLKHTHTLFDFVWLYAIFIYYDATLFVTKQFNLLHFTFLCSHSWQALS